MTGEGSRDNHAPHNECLKIVLNGGVKLSWSKRLCSGGVKVIMSLTLCIVSSHVGGREFEIGRGEMVKRL